MLRKAANYTVEIVRETLKSNIFPLRDSIKVHSFCDYGKYAGIPSIADTPQTPLKYS